jgi:hypothetical protein
MTPRYFLPALALIVLLPLARAADWPQFRGPNRDDISQETGLLKSWPKDGPPLVWQAKELGSGYSSLSVAGDRVFTLGNKDKVSKVIALDRDNGKPVWSAEVGPAGGHLGCTATASSPSARKAISFASKPRTARASGIAT